MENMDPFELDLSGPAALRRRALQERLAADGGWLGLFGIMCGEDPGVVDRTIGEYMALADGATSDAERGVNAEANQTHLAATGEDGGAIVDRTFMQLAASGNDPRCIPYLMFSLAIQLAAHPGQPIGFPGQE